MIPKYAREALQRKSFQDAHLVALITDPAGRTLWTSDSFQRLTGYGLDELAGRRPGQVLYGPDTDPEAAAAIMRALKTRKPVKTPIVGYKKDGTPMWVDVEVLPLFDERAACTGFISFGKERPCCPFGPISSAPYCILVAEDHPINLKLVLALLQAAGCETHCAVNGKEALALFDEMDFDMVVMDSQMPVLTGVEAIAEIRNRSDWKQRIPIMSLTAHAMKGAEEYHTMAGADYYMSKPIRSDCFIGAVKSLSKCGRDLRIAVGDPARGILSSS